MPWTTMFVKSKQPISVEKLFGICYEGHDPYENTEIPAHVDYERFYGFKDAGKFGGGIIGYLYDEETMLQVTHSLNFFTPPWEEGWRWEPFDDLNEDDHQKDFAESLAEGTHHLYDHAGKLRGYLLDSPAAVYVILAVLNQGPAPKFGKLPYIDFSTVEGRLEIVSVHDHLSFFIWETLTNHRIECLATESQLSQATSLLQKRVAVTGRVHYRNHVPKSIDVESLRGLRDTNELPQPKDIGPINITDGLSSEEHVRRLRNG